MHFSSIAITSLSVSLVYGHGLITVMRGANGVNMPGLSVLNGTPRNCAVHACSAQADTAIIRDAEIKNGRSGPLGRTEGAGVVDADSVIRNFMGTSSNKSKRDTLTTRNVKQDIASTGNGLSRSALGLRGKRKARRQLFGSNSDLASPVENQSDAPGDTMPGGGKGIGLPTCNDDNSVNFIYRQVNTDGAGPLTCAVDPTSGGRDAAAFVNCKMVLNIPGFSGLSMATKTDFAAQAQIPPDMVCRGEVGGEQNVCILRVRNPAVAGPFGGSVAFKQGQGNAALSRQN